MGTELSDMVTQDVYSPSEKFQKFDNEKPKYGMILRFAPLDAVLWIVKVMAFGAAKYGKDNWQKAEGGEIERYEDAMVRHWKAWKDGEFFDAESKLPHLAHMGCNNLFLIWHHCCKKP